MIFFVYRSLACDWICGSRLPGIVSAQSNTSALFCSTASAFASTFDEIFTSTLTRPAGIPGMFIRAHFGFLTTENEASGTTFVIMYGPTPGGGLFGWFFIGVPLGTSASAGNASTFPNAPYGAIRWIVIVVRPGAPRHSHRDATRDRERVRNAAQVPGAQLRVPGGRYCSFYRPRARRDFIPFG